MFRFFVNATPVLFIVLQAFGATAEQQPLLFGPTVRLDEGVFTGSLDGLLVEKYLGIRYAKPPIGDLRYRLPQKISPYHGIHDATKFGPACPQIMEKPAIDGLPPEAVDYILNSTYGQSFPESEDCLTLNVIRPLVATSTSNLPVVVWIFGGGFSSGSTAFYDGGSIVSRSILIGNPVIYVSMNYRLGGFGFLPGKEVKAAGVGNLGLQDQREALRWVQRYISRFGGDPAKVTVWGESAGAFSVATHMVSNDVDAEPLFRAAFMQSGAPAPVGDITLGQDYYDQLVTYTGCSNADDTLSCLRTVPYSDLKKATESVPGIFSYQSLRLAWLPRVDGAFLTANPLLLVKRGKVANIPYIIGNCDDEGTLFSLSTLNITTEKQLREWVKTVFLPGVTDTHLDTLTALYPADVKEGSPFNTSIFNAVTPQFKRIAAFQGDGAFQVPRRWLLQHTVDQNPNVWVYLSKRSKATPVLGSVHAHDISNIYGEGELADYLIRFVSHLDPNPNSGFFWPKYDKKEYNILTFLDGLIPQIITEDTYRKDAMEYIAEMLLSLSV